MKSFPHDSFQLVTRLKVMMILVLPTTHSTKSAHQHLNPPGTENTEQLHKLQMMSRFHIAILKALRPASIQNLIKKKKRKTINGIYFFLFCFFFTRFVWAALM